MTRRKGKSHSRRPVSKRAPSWTPYTPEETEAFVIRLAKDGHSPSMIGTILRDQYGIPIVKYITGQSITEIMESADIALEIPEDLTNLLQKATRLHRHLAKNRSDAVNKRALEIVSSKIRHLAKYYQKKGKLAQTWKYQPERLIAL